MKRPTKSEKKAAKRKRTAAKVAERAERLVAWKAECDAVDLNELFEEVRKEIEEGRSIRPHRSGGGEVFKREGSA